MQTETNKIKKHIEKNHLATVRQIAELLGVTYITAERKLLNLEIKGEIYREEYKSPNSSRTFRHWRLKK